jgi:hypothetical protein
MSPAPPTDATHVLARPFAQPCLHVTPHVPVQHFRDTRYDVPFHTAFHAKIFSLSAYFLFHSLPTTRAPLHEIGKRSRDYIKPSSSSFTSFTSTKPYRSLDIAIEDQDHQINRL